MIRSVVVALVMASLLAVPVTAQVGGTTTGTGQTTTPTVQPSQPVSSGTTATTGGGGGYSEVSKSQSVPTAGEAQKVESEKKPVEAKEGKKEKKKNESEKRSRVGFQGLTRSLRELRYYALATAAGLAIMAVMMGYGLVKFERRLSQRSTKAKARETEKTRKKPLKVERKLRKTEPEEEEVEMVRKLWKRVKEGD